MRQPNYLLRYTVYFNFIYDLLEVWCCRRIWQVPNTRISFAETRPETWPSGKSGALKSTVYFTVLLVAMQMDSLTSSTDMEAIWTWILYWSLSALDGTMRVLHTDNRPTKQPSVNNDIKLCELIDWLIGVLTARQHRKVNLCQLRGKETGSVG